MQIDKSMRFMNNHIISDYPQDTEIKRFDAVTFLPLSGIVQNFIEDDPRGIRVTVPIRDQTWWCIVPLDGVTKP